MKYRKEAGRRIYQRLVQAAVREQLVPPEHVQQEERLLYIRLGSGEAVQIPIQQRFTFNRFDIDENFAGDPQQFLHMMHEQGWIADGPRYNRFQEELHNSVENYAQVLAEAGRRFDGAQAASTWAWLQEHPDDQGLIFFEQLVMDGHPLHPGAKIKMGMTAADVRTYSPEWGTRLHVRLAAVRREQAVLVQADEATLTELLYEEYPYLREAVAQELAQLGLHAADYELLPLHPWQAEHTLPSLYAHELEDQQLVLLHDARLPAAPLMSFRSLAPLHAARHHFKTAVHIQMTGAVRTVSPQSVQNGPRLSRILRAVQQQEQYFSGKFRILEERAGIYFNPSGKSEAEAFTLQKNAAALLRENPEWFIEPGDIIMPAAALLAQSPFRAGTIAVELIEKGDGPITQESVCAFVQDYAKVCLPPLLTCMSKYGISMEGHLQNSVAVFREGKPVQLMLRDFGGVRIMPERLAQQGLHMSFHRGSAIEADDVADLRNKMFYPVFQNHFGELIASLVRHTDVSEALLWREIARVCQSVYQHLRQDKAIAAQAEEDEAALFAPYMDLKAMVTMRLRGDVTDYTFTKVQNPLREWE